MSSLVQKSRRLWRTLRRAAAAVLLALQKLLGKLNSRTFRDRMAWCVFLTGLSFVPLKILDWWLPNKDNLAVAISRGLEKRFDDPSFWTIIGAAVSCIMIYKVSSERACLLPRLTFELPGCPAEMRWFGLFSWIGLSVFGWAVYLWATWKAHEALFARPLVVTQAIEGLLNLFVIPASYLFAVLGFCVVKATSTSSARENMDCRQRCYAPAWIFYAVFVPAFLLVILYLLEKLQFPAFAKKYFNWTFEPFKGKSPEEALGVFVLFWGPCLLLALYAGFSWRASLKLIRTDTLKFLPPFLPVFCICKCQEKKTEK
jgi:hypothetical protein